MIIAVDGPSASGKGTIARALAMALGLPHLDTGLLYRAVGQATLAVGDDPADAAAAAAHARQLRLDALDDPALRLDEAARAASMVAAHPCVRDALRDLQVRFARQAGGAVLDGRDIGTVIAPDADLKIFVTANAQTRAERRYAELQARGLPTSLAAVAADIAARDARDSGRGAAPLRMAEDAILLDTTNLSIDAAIQSALALADARRGTRAIVDGALSAADEQPKR